mmetsp:Transcript_66928/g.169022  ORF Transcript_66928/g.169022 Transcript_66928/m.169022 type:complete len:214 (-) Transcript_66928:139-780(-)
MNLRRHLPHVLPLDPQHGFAHPHAGCHGHRQRLRRGGHFWPAVCEGQRPAAHEEEPVTWLSSQEELAASTDRSVLDSDAEDLASEQVVSHIELVEEGVPEDLLAIHLIAKVSLQTHRQGRQDLHVLVVQPPLRLVQRQLRAAPDAGRELHGDPMLPQVAAQDRHLVQLFAVQAAEAVHGVGDGGNQRRESDHCHHDDDDIEGTLHVIRRNNLH